MSNDLISRKALMEGRVENDPVKIAAMCAPTAYDVDAVCKELEKRAERANRRSGKCEGLGKFSEAFLNNLEFNTIIEDIKTVRNGGKKK